MIRKRWYLPLALLVLLGALILAVAARGPATAGSRDEEHENEALTYRGSTACGVERWAVKTGIDADARKVNPNHVVSANIVQLRSLPAPSDLPLRSRIRPTELTVYRLTAYLIRFKKESDSDYHLVLSDTGGRTMIAEIPAPDCVGSTSPFLSRIKTARSTFDHHYEATDFWHRLKVPVTVTGVGFFDFKHGQSGVAPNAIELHPVLSIAFGGSTSRSAPPAPPPPPAGGSLKLTAWVSQAKTGRTTTATVYARTVPGASCSASVVYSTGRTPRSFNGSTQRSGSDGVVHWSWHKESKGSGGTATVTCTYRGQRATATASF